MLNIMVTHIGSVNLTMSYSKTFLLRKKIASLSVSKLFHIMCFKLEYF
jgi:hypothetical protein